MAMSQYKKYILVFLLALVLVVAANEGSSAWADLTDSPIDEVQSGAEAVTEEEANEGEGDEEAGRSGDLNDEEEENNKHNKKEDRIPFHEILKGMMPSNLGENKDGVSKENFSRKQSVPEKEGMIESAGMTFTSPGELTNKTKVVTKRATCSPTDTDDNIMLLNATGLQALVTPSPNSSVRATPMPCTLVFFFSHMCKFSVAAVPQINALRKRLEGRMPVYAVDSRAQHSINAQYGVMGTPALLIFHGKYSLGHYNSSSYTTENLADFFSYFTDYEYDSDYNITEDDYSISSPLPLEVTPPSGIYIIAAWLFLLSCAFYSFVKSNFFDAMFEAVLNSWREAEAHQHQD